MKSDQLLFPVLFVISMFCFCFALILRPVFDVVNLYKTITPSFSMHVVVFLLFCCFYLLMVFLFPFFLCCFHYLQSGSS